MSWLRHVVIDLAVTAVIVVATVFQQPWAAWVVWIYTPLMLLLKVAALSGNVGRAAASPVPDWFYHVVYAVNVVLLLVHAWYLWAAGWAAIWILSAVASARTRGASS